MMDTCVVRIDGAHAVLANYKYFGVAENSFGEVKYTIESSVGEASFEYPSFVLISKHFQKNMRSLMKFQGNESYAWQEHLKYLHES